MIITSWTYSLFYVKYTAIHPMPKGTGIFALCHKEITSSYIIKGYEYQKGKYVTFSQDELDLLKTKKDKTIYIDSTAKISEVDPILFDENYYIIPARGAEKAYEILRKSLFLQKKVAVARSVLGSKQDLLVLYPRQECLIAKILFYQEEIQELPKSQATVDVSKQELEMGKSIVDSLTKKFDISNYYDEYQQRIREAITTKIEGNDIVAVDTALPENIIVNTMEALQKTIEMLAEENRTGAV